MKGRLFSPGCDRVLTPQKGDDLVRSWRQSILLQLICGMMINGHLRFSPPNGWVIRENPIKTNDLEVPPISRNHPYLQKNEIGLIHL